jgi:hypothetical protein
MSEGAGPFNFTFFYYVRSKVLIMPDNKMFFLFDSTNINATQKHCKLILVETTYLYDK